MNNITEMQQRLITSPSKIILAANSRGSGHTTGLVLRGILDKETTHVKFYQPNYKMLSLLLDKTVGVLETLGIEYKVNRYQYFILILSSGKRINFCLPESEDECESNLRFKKRIGNTLVILDQVDFFEQYFIDYQTELQKRNGNTLMFSTQPFNCGWRDIKTSQGYPVFSDNGLPETLNTSWDYNLVNWVDLGTATRAKPTDYYSEVEVITGYGINTFLDGENKNYSKFMNTLPESESLRVSGTWRKGMKLVDFEENN